jgi:hypothetical protein
MFSKIILAVAKKASSTFKAVLAEVSKNCRLFFLAKASPS